jgi:PAS domain S-box-containing protein
MRSSMVNGPRHAELTPILDTVLDAVVVIGLDGVIVAWNAVAEQTFGWRAEQAIGQSLAELVVPPEHRNAHNAGIARLLAGEPPRVLNRLIEITALTASGTQIPVELSITTGNTADGRLFVGFLRDISRKKSSEEALRRQASEAQLMFDVARMAAEAESFDEALQEVLAAICRLSGWSVGHAFVVSDSDPPRLLSTSIWYEENPGDAQPMRAATEGIKFELNVGLPGTILATGEPLWVADADKEGNFPRAISGFRGAFGFPLKSGGRTIAILEFFARSPTPPDATRLLTVRILGEQVGRLFERRRREDRERLLLHELNHRVKNLLMVIQAIAKQTFRNVASSDEGLEAFSGRLTALSRAQDLMLSSEWTAVELRELLSAAIEGSGNSLDRFRIDGPELKVSSNHAVSVALAVHELCTNSVKYGALSAPAGLVKIGWKMDAAREHVAFEWREQGGPLIEPPSRKGFGSTLLTSNLSSALGGEVQVEYPPEGLIFRVHAPLSALNRPQ